ncbi:MAG: DUF2723 domain-containing protein [Patescibacteria group bacterium]|jgi:4-amino-4-deoxy-L-arabinose transferase-like glycosyltransferase
MASTKLKTHYRYMLLIIGLWLLTTVPVITRYPISWDAAQYTLGVEHFSVAMHQPHPPGYPLYELTGKLLANIFSGHTSLLLITNIFVLVASLAFYILVWLIWRQRWLATVLTIALLVNPLTWFYRADGSTYPIDLALGIGLALFTYLFAHSKVVTERNRWLYISAITLGLGSGFRPSTLVLLLPLLVLQWIYLKQWRIILISAGLLIGSVLIWFIPLLGVSGWLEYFKISWSQYGYAGTSSWFTVNLFKHFLVTTLVSWNWLLIPIGITVWKHRYVGERFYWWWGLAWGGLATLVYSLIHFGQTGYALLLMPIGYVLAGRGIEWCYYVWYRSGSLNKKVFSILLLVVWLVAHASVFLIFTPSYAHPNYRPQRRIDLILQRLVKFAPALAEANISNIKASEQRMQNLKILIEQYPAEATLVITGRDVLYGNNIRNDEPFRELSAVLPDYQIMQFSPNYLDYLSAQHNQLIRANTNTVAVAKSIKYVILVFDQLPNTVKPTRLLLEQRALSDNQAYYIGIMDYPFTFLGHTIQR